ncbi:hypothetical protein BCON_1107g00020 [Botryotinia convoluta]|uniref:CmcJ-like methyltransferase n=1 Tax=Botryotinia convoluta TaxID=54673 RepID=A0A4Z1HAA6_9HELO|nr:hypothetical protein BCON_1107g00020 [Botryotinia convoluta]
MASSATLKCIKDTMKQTTGTVFYLKRDALYERTKPYFCYIPLKLLNGAPVTNQEYAPSEISITSLRGQERNFRLDKNGFEVLEHPLNAKYTLKSLREDATLMEQYEREIETVLKQMLGAEKVVVFDEELRKRNQEFPKSLGERSALEQPVRGVHVDSSPTSAIERAVYICDTPAERARLGGRIQIINTWRPLFDELNDWPLALCDSRSINLEEDLIPSDSVFPETVSETLQVFQNTEHKWYFLDGQKMNEMLLFKIFDSDDSVSRFCPHASFEYGDVAKARPRESVEIRAVVFYGKAGER